jgi:protein-tyrosine-phosphatase
LPCSCDPEFVPGLVPAPAIHFVCTGNLYRSRLAEAYCASRCARGVRVLSSGIAAGANGSAPISPYAADVLIRYGLHSFAAESWQRTTEALVTASDVLVFMESEHYRFCENWIQPARQKIEVWEIEDIGPIPAEAISSKVERTFALIRRRTDVLLNALGLAPA